MKEKLTLTMISIILASCYMKPKFNPDFEKSDLNPRLVDSLNYYGNTLYKMPKELSNDFIVSTVRSNAIIVEGVTVPVKISLNLLAAKNNDVIDTTEIRKKLSDKEWKTFLEAFPDALIKTASFDEEYNETNILHEQLTCTPQIVDAHWAYFSASGNLGVIDKIIESYKVVGTPCCFSCIEWSLPSQASQNKDVYDHLVNKRASLDENGKKWISRFIPKEEQCKWYNFGM